MTCAAPGQQRLVEQVVDVDAAGGEELRVFLAKNPITQNAASHVRNPQSVRYDEVPPTLDASRPTAERGAPAWAGRGLLALVSEPIGAETVSAERFHCCRA